MSKLYTLTKEIHQLIETINKQKGKELRVESDYYWVGEFPIFNNLVQIKTKEYLFERIEQSAFSDEVKTLIQHKCFSTLNPKNIQQLLCDLDLGESKCLYSSKYSHKSIEDKCDCAKWDDNGYQHEPYCASLNSRKLLPKTQAKADIFWLKWFSLNVAEGQKPTPSLWNSGEKGQIQVLTELKEVLENYLKN